MVEVSQPSESTSDDAISRRRHERVTTRGMVHARIKQPMQRGIEGLEYVMEIVEISPAGLRIRSSEVLEAHAIDLTAAIDGYATKIFLSTNVRWQENDAEGNTLFGVEIDDNDASDVDAWCDFQREEWFRKKKVVGS